MLAGDFDLNKVFGSCCGKNRKNKIKVLIKQYKIPKMLNKLPISSIIIPKWRD